MAQVAVSSVGAGEGRPHSDIRARGVIGQGMRAHLGAWGLWGPDLNRDRGLDGIIVMVSGQLFWGRVSCQGHTPPWGPVHHFC